jgi:ABC-type sugar transport system ATPase subunit
LLHHTLTFRTIAFSLPKKVILNDAPDPDNAPETGGVAVDLRNVTKSFGGVSAVRGVTFAIAPGEVVALAGENGAGKSTIKNLIGGILRADSGDINVFDAPQSSGVAGLRAQGVSTIHQEISLFPHLSVAENVLINRLGQYSSFNVSQRRLIRDATPYLERVGAHFPPSTLVADLSTGQAQLVEIAKALADDPRVVVFDEPTSSLNLAERERVLTLVEDLRDTGVAVLYIGHSLDEIFRISDRVVVMRDGAVVGDEATFDLTRSSLEQLMVGRELAEGYPALEKPGETIALRVRAVSDDFVHDIELEVHEGEIFGLAGLMGAGRTEAARAIFGLSTATGTVEVQGRAVRRNDPRAAIRAGIAFVTEDRRDEGIFLERPIRETLTVVSLDGLLRVPFLGLIDRKAERAAAASQAETLRVSARAGLEAQGGSLSGGNQQKVVLSKWLSTNPRVLILDEPTRGIDVGAKAEIYRILARLASESLAILLISSEMEEVLGMSHRIGVMSGGRLVGTLDRAEADQAKLIRLATGGAL